MKAFKINRVLFFTCGLFACFVFWGTSLLGQNTLIWASYYGGAGNDRTYSTATDASGNVFIAGYTDSPANISSGGFQNAYGGGVTDAFLVKFDAAGNRLWATYYGGAGLDEARGVTTDAAGNVYITGYTTSTAGISSGGFQNAYGGGFGDAFLVKFDAAGNRLWATYYGGTSVDESYTVATDAAGNVYISGRTTSTTGIASGGFQNTFGGGGVVWDAFLVKFDAVTGNRLWATYYGDTGTEEGYSVCVDALGNVYLTGVTDSPVNIASGGFSNTLTGAVDAFLVKFDAAGNRLWATYYGGLGTEYGYSVCNDPSGNVFLGGATGSASGVSSGGFQNTYGGGTYDVFLVKFSPAGLRLWATYYGGTLSEELLYDGLATDASGNIFVAGDSYSTNTGNAIASGGFQNALVGQENHFVAKFDPSGARLCATYYGQFHEEYASVAIDNSGNVYMSGLTPSTSNIASGGFQNTHGGGVDDAYLVKFTSCFNNILSITVAPTNIPCNGQCVGTATVTPTSGTSPYTYAWSNSQTTSAVTGLCAGNYSVLVTDGAASTATATITIIQPSALTTTAAATAASCGNNNGTATVTVGGGTAGYTYLWLPTAAATATATGLSPGNYSVTITDANGCTATQTVTVTSVNSLSVTASSTQAGCTVNNGTATANSGSGTAPYTYSWSNGGTNSQISNLSAQTYSVIVTDSNGCTATASTTVTSASGITAGISASPLSISQGAGSTLSASGGGTYLWSNGATDATIPVSPTVTTLYCVTVTDTNGCSDSACVTIVVTIEPTDCSNAGELYLPNAFSPNNDGENDFLHLYFGKIECIETYKLVIYSRWGEKVFETTDPLEMWSGSYKSQDEKPALFIYYLESTLVGGKKIKRKGNISLIR